MKRSFIITAGGIGRRMGADVPKQFLQLGGKPILMQTIDQLHRFDKVAEIILTLPESYLDTWKDLTEEYDFHTVHTVVVGGKERFHSIEQALRFCSGDVVAVHDGVRPLVSTETLHRLFDEAKHSTAVIPVIPVRESLRRKTSEKTVAVPRTDYLIVQTPQVFNRKLLIEAYNQEYIENFTDDASVVENLGHVIATVEGNEENIKITSPGDLLLAEALLKLRSDEGNF